MESLNLAFSINYCVITVFLLARWTEHDAFDALKLLYRCETGQNKRIAENKSYR